MTLAVVRFGFWMPVFGGWLRNVEDEGMPATFAYQRELAQQADRTGWDVTLIAERYARTEEFLAVLKGMWTRDEYTLEGRYYTIKNARLAPKPVQKPRPVLYAGGESPAAKDLIARECDAYLMHGDPPEVLATKIEDMRARRATHPELPPLRFGVAGYAIVRNSDSEVKKEIGRITDVNASARGYASYQDFIKGSQLETTVSLEDYSVSNRGLRTGLVGTPEQVASQVRALERIGIDLLLLQSSPQREEMQRFSEEVFPLAKQT